MTRGSDRDGEALRQLDLIRVVAIADALLLVPLLLSVTGVVHGEGYVPIVGPIHGAGFLLLIGLCARGALDDLWGWWFPAVVVITLGPLGSLVGEEIERRRIVSSRPS